MAIERRIDVNRLLALAAERSRASRNELLNAIVDLFLPAEDRLTDQQRALMTDVLGKLIGSIEIEVRQYLVEALLRSRVDLPDLEAMLANDRIEVARPILERSRVIRDTDLIAVVMQRAEEHRMAIALRAGLSETVSDALVDRAGPEVLEALIRNPDATLSRRAMEYLVAESKRYDRFQEPLLSRNDLPADLAYQMYWWVSAALRRHILQNFRVDEVALDEAIENAARRGMTDYEEGQTAQARALRLANRLNELGELTDSFLLQTLRQARLNLFVGGLAARGHLSFRTAWRIVSDRGFEGFIVLARAIEMTRDTMAAIVLVLDGLQNSTNARPPSMLNDILALFDELEPARARQALRLWQLDPTYQSAISEVEQGHAA